MSKSPAFSNLVGKRAKNTEQLSAEARSYVQARMYGRGGWLEAGCGFWHRTLPVYMGKGRRPSAVGLLNALVRTVIICGAAFVPIAGRRALFSRHEQLPGWAGVVALANDLTTVDFVLGVAGVLFLAVPKIVEGWSKRQVIKPHTPYGELAAAIDKVPSVDHTKQSDLQLGLTHALSALRLEMSELIGDEHEKRVTDVTLLVYCDYSGNRMQVMARTAVGEPLNRPRESDRKSVV